MAAAKGRWAPGRPAVGNYGLRGARPRGAVRRSPRQGAWQTKPATSSCRAFRAVFCPGPAAAAKGQWGPIRPAVENCGLHLRNRRGRLIAAPGRGLGKRSPQRPVAGCFVRFPPTGDGRGQGRWGSGRPVVRNCGLRLRNRRGRLGSSPHSPCPLPSPNLGRGERGNTPPLILAPVPRGEG